MRKEFVAAFLDLARRDERILFLTGDLGFMALEPLRDELKNRFLNAGVAEQNMVSVAAGLAARGFQPWLYSIAPFVTLRPYEQLRNDVCLHNLDVKIVGNGGGYGYGIMGSTHHTLEDVGCLQMLPHMKVRVPCFSEDVVDVLALAHQTHGPSYVRLGQGNQRKGLAPAENWRKIANGNRAVAVGSGPILKALLQILPEFPSDSIAIYDISQFPLTEIPGEIVRHIERCGSLITLDEHVAAGGLGQAVSHLLLGRLQSPIHYLPLSANGYPSGRYGSQNWHWEENGLAGAPLKGRLLAFLNIRKDRPMPFVQRTPSPELSQ